MIHIQNNPSEGIGGAYLFGDATIEDVWMDETREDLLLTMLCGRREWRIAGYQGVYYNEITRRGATIALAEQWPLAALEAPRFRGAYHRFIRECGMTEPAFLQQLSRRGVRLFVHYARDRDYIVLARRIELHAK